jgi:hypothetical protein
MGKVADFFREQNIPLGQQQRAKMLSLDREVVELEAKVKVLESENLHLKAEVNPMKREIQRLQDQVQQSSASVVTAQYVCDHCGSPKLKRIGNRPDPVFRGLGIKQAVFSCLACGKESAFTQDP